MAQETVHTENNPADLRQKRARRLFGTLFLLGSLWAALWIFKLRWATPGESFWTTMLYVLCTLPTIMFVAGHPFRIPLMPMWGLVYFIMFGMPMLIEDFQEGLEFFAPEATVVNALRLAALGAGACVLTFYTPMGRWVESFIPKVKAPWDPRRAPLIGVGLTLIGMGLNYYRLNSSSSPAWAQLIFLGSQLALVGIVTLFLLQLRSQLSLSLKLFLWGFAVPVEFLLGLGTGFIYEVLRSLAPLMFCYAAERQRIPWQMLVIGTLCLLPLAGSVKQEFRSVAWYGQGYEISVSTSPIQRGLSFVGLATKRMVEGGMETYSASAESAQARIGHLGVFITILEMTPAMVPFWKGETYLTLFWTPIPRFLFPGKPTKTLGQDFGHRYGLLDPWDEATSFNLPYQVIEMYINFGSFGIIFGMAVVGCIYRALAVLLGHPDVGERGLIIGCALFSNMLILESDFSLVFGGAVYYLLIMYFFTRFLQPQKTGLAVPE